MFSIYCTSDMVTAPLYPAGANTLDERDGIFRSENLPLGSQRAAWVQGAELSPNRAGRDFKTYARAKFVHANVPVAAPVSLVQCIQYSVYRPPAAFRKKDVYSVCSLC